MLGLQVHLPVEHVAGQHQRTAEAAEGICLKVMLQHHLPVHVPQFYCYPFPRYNGRRFPLPLQQDAFVVKGLAGAVDSPVGKEVAGGRVLGLVRSQHFIGIFI